MLGMQLVTHQTGPEGQKVRRLYIEQGLDIARELTSASLVDRDARRIAVMASTEGGMDIEKVADDTPEKISRVHVDPAVGLAGYQARKLGFALGLEATGSRSSSSPSSSRRSTSCFVNEDCSLSRSTRSS